MTLAATAADDVVKDVRAAKRLVFGFLGDETLARLADEIADEVHVAVLVAEEAVEALAEQLFTGFVLRGELVERRHERRFLCCVFCLKIPCVVEERLLERLPDLRDEHEIAVFEQQCCIILGGEAVFQRFELFEKSPCFGGGACLFRDDAGHRSAFPADRDEPFV